VAAAEATARLVADLLEAGRRVAVADCAHPNGADPALVRALQVVVGGEWERLSGYAGWNTAGNTIGTAVAHGLAVVAANVTASWTAPRTRRCCATGCWRTGAVDERGPRRGPGPRSQRLLAA